MSHSFPFPGVIFDIDGVLLDSNPAHLASWQQMAREEGFDFTPQLFQETFGQRSDAILANHWNRPLSGEEIERLVCRKEYLYREMVKKNLPEMPGASDFLKELFRLGYPLSVGSSGPGINVNFVLERLGVLPFLKGVISGSDVSRGKPAPDIFLACAEKMSMPPEACCVIDDSASGVRSALDAGMKVIGFFSGGHHLEEYEGADLLVYSFSELSPEKVSALFD